MSNKNKKILIIIALVVIIIIIVFLIFIKIQTTPSQSDKVGETNTVFPFFSNTKPDTKDEQNDNVETDINEKDIIVSSDFVPVSKRKRLMKLTDSQIAGAHSVNIDNINFVKYVQRSNGYVYQIDMETLQRGSLSRLIIPSIYKVVWGKDNSEIILRYLSDSSAEPNDTIRSYLINLNQRDDITDNYFFQDGAKQLIMSPDKTKIFYLKNSDENQGVHGVLVNLNNPQKLSQIFFSPLKEWLVEWPTQEQLILTTKASYGLPGYIFSVNTNTGEWTKIFGDKNGLTTNANSDSSQILFSEHSNKNNYISIFNTNTKEETLTNFKTVSEKCIWSNLYNDTFYCATPKNYTEKNLPDTWYRGEVSFNDKIELMNLNTKVGTEIINLSEESGENIDVIEPFLSSDEKYLFFINKIDNTLWVLDLQFNS